MIRKKTPAGSGSRVTKRAVAPLNGTRRDELIEGVVNQLKPWKNDNSRATVMAAVNQSVDALLELIPLQQQLYDPRPIRKHAKKLNKALSNVQKLLASSPGMLGAFIYDPRPALMLDPSEKLGSASQARADALDAELRRLRGDCARDYGVHPNYDHAKHLSAEISFVLMIKYSDRTIVGTENEAFRTIAGQLYEVVSGKKDADLKRACDEALHYMSPKLYQTTN